MSVDVISNILFFSNRAHSDGGTAMIDKEKTPVAFNASDNMVKESIEKVYETAVVSTVQVEQAASFSSMIEESRSSLMDSAQGNLSNLTKTSTDVTQAVKPVLTDEKPMTCSFSQDFATSQKNFSSVENSTVTHSSQGMGL